MNAYFQKSAIIFWRMQDKVPWFYKNVLTIVAEFHSLEKGDFVGQLKKRRSPKYAI